MNTKWKRNACSMVLLVLFSAPVFAQEESGSLSMNASLSTDYVFRFISQTQEDPAVSGGVDWESGSGFYLGVWGSNVDFEDDARLEIDFYGGYQFETTAGWGFNFGLIDYEYFNDEANDNTLEGLVSVAKGPASVSVYYDLKNGEYYWVEGGLEHDFDKVSTSLTLGTFLPDKGDGYTGWSVSASVPYRSINYSLTAFGTDSDGRVQYGKLADTRVIFSIGSQF